MSTNIESLKPKNTSYRYTAIGEKGKLIKGSIKAVSEGAATNLLVERGLNLVSLIAQPPWYSLDQMFPSMFAVKPQEIVNFSKQLATLLDAGISLLPAIDSVRQNAQSRGFKKVLGEVIKDLGSGLSFSESISKHPKVFTDIFCKTLSVAESTGDAPTILRQLAEYQEKSDLSKQKIKKAMRYPMVMASLGLVVGVILMTVALPPLMDMFQIMNVDLPITTRILIGISGFMGKYQLYVLGILVAIVLLVVYLVKQPAGRRWLDGVLLRAPVIGTAVHASELARLARTSQVLINSGLALQEVWELLPQTSGNIAMKEAMEKVQHELVRGEGITEPMNRQPRMFPRLLTQMVKVGEESNSLAYSFGIVADFYEKDADEKISGMISKIAPTMTIVMAGMVAFLALSIIMPMYSIMGSVA